MKAVEFVKKYGQERVFNFIKNPLKLDSDTEFLLNYSGTHFNPTQLKQDEFECDEFAELDENEWYWVPRCFGKSDEDIVENDFASVADLKQIVEAWKLVENQGGLISSKKYLKFLQASVDIGLYHGLDNVNYETEIPLLRDAIACVEQCQ